MGVTETFAIDAASIDALFQGAGKRRKGEFSLELAAEFAQRRANGQAVAVPNVIAEMFDYLYAETPTEEPPTDDAPPAN